jgi:hypothetical protein
MRATARIADVSFNTVSKLLIDAGRICLDYQDRALRNLKCQRLQLDEIWSFIGVKARNQPFSKRAGDETAGDVWTWVAVDADTRLVPSWRVGDRVRPQLSLSAIFQGDSPAACKSQATGIALIWQP